MSFQCSSYPNFKTVFGNNLKALRISTLKLPLILMGKIGVWVILHSIRASNSPHFPTILGYNTESTLFLVGFFNYTVIKYWLQQVTMTYTKNNKFSNLEQKKFKVKWLPAIIIFLM